MWIEIKEQLLVTFISLTVCRPAALYTVATIVVVFKETVTMKASL